jgi:pyruvate,orthophosphate dikinase
MTKWVYQFNQSKTDGNKTMKDLLGGKGANLAEMSSLGLAVPPGCTITTQACLDYFDQDLKINDAIKKDVESALQEIEKITGKKFGDNKNPLLFSVRSGSAVSMPGMMDTVLNLGLNDQTVVGLENLTNNSRFAWDSYRRFIQMYANVVLDINISTLESTLEDLKEARGVEYDSELTGEDFKELVSVYKSVLLTEHGIAFPQNPIDQLWKAIAAVFRSWNTNRAIRYRELNSISHTLGTAVNVQSMVFGNMGEDSATGVCFTRDPSTGHKRFFGEYLLNAQGEDVVAGIRTPWPINNDSKNEMNKQFKTLQESMPKTFSELTSVYQKLEKHYRDMQDIEFTIEKGKLFILQTRNGKRTTQAALKIAVDLVEEKVISKNEALVRIKPDELNQLLHPRFDPKAQKDLLARGLPASPGAACGIIVFDPEKAFTLNIAGKKVLLVRQETSPEDIAGMVAAQGIVTSRGGMTSHAAVVARGMGKPCIVGCSSLHLDEEKGLLTISGKTFNEGDFLSIDGATGEIYSGQVKTIDAELSGEFGIYMSWADEVRTLKIRTNADNPQDSAVALKFGAEGIGLCRTEHMFFDPERILAVREMIFAENSTDRNKALQKIMPFQKNDFLEIFKVMQGKPVNIRLLDPPLHEFLPTKIEDMTILAEALDVELEEIKNRIESLHEFNPMLGHRGCRLGVTYPEIYRMQVRAIMEAALECEKMGIKVFPEIMIPLVGIDQELSYLKKESEEEIAILFKKYQKRIDYKLGTMIELPRAALTADQIALHADFFSFGTNDLTQTTYGLSRDDSGKFLPDYISKNMFQVDPFVRLDEKGVGRLVQMACELGRKANPKIHIGICGEHGGEFHSIKFFHKAGLDYVSCSPYRVPIARLSAAQAILLK